MMGVPSNQPYVKPEWSASPNQPFRLEILKEGNSLGVVDVSEKGAYMFGRSDRCDFVLEHPTVSRYHAVLQYNAKSESFLYDLGSTHGTFVNKIKVNDKAYVPLHVGDIICFGQSSRLHLFDGPRNLMPEEGLSRVERQKLRSLEATQERAEKEASLLRGKRLAMEVDGATWGMGEDAEEEEEEEDSEEITWQTFKGQLTEKQQKSHEKIVKRNEKLANLKKENDAIQAKELSQGGLTQGQQTQIARNEQRMQQLLEEVENIEETLNESIRESISGGIGKGKLGKKAVFGNEDGGEEDNSSGDDFYDRTSKQKHQKKKDKAVQKVETAESLLDKRAALSKEIDSVLAAIKDEEEQCSAPNGDAGILKVQGESVDPLDQYMTDISSGIVKDRAAKLKKELNVLLKESERTARLLKIADPTKEALKKWEIKQKEKEKLTGRFDRMIFSRKKNTQELGTSTPVKENEGQPPGPEVSHDSEEQKSLADSSSNTELATQGTTELRTLDPPLRLGAPVEKVEEERILDSSDGRSEESESFISYKDRKKYGAEAGSVERKVDETGTLEECLNVDSEGAKFESGAAASVALLKHKLGVIGDEEVIQHTKAENSAPSSAKCQTSVRSWKKRKSYGPAKPAFLTDLEDYEGWVPPAGQTGDGRTALNDKLGY